MVPFLVSNVDEEVEALFRFTLVLFGLDLLALSGGKEGVGFRALVGNRLGTRADRGGDGLFGGHRGLGFGLGDFPGRRRRLGR